MSRANMHAESNTVVRATPSISASYVTHATLLKTAIKNKCAGIRTEPVIALCRPEKNFWVFKATVYQIHHVSRLRWLWRRSSWQCLSFDLQPRRDADGRNPSRQPRLAQSLRDWLMFGRGTATVAVESRTDFSSPQGSAISFAVSERSPPCAQKSKASAKPRSEAPSSKGYTALASSSSGPPATPLSPVWRRHFRILEPATFAGNYIRTRLYCHDRALWKLRWFLRAFRYDRELMAADELDDRRVVGLEGVIRLAYWGDVRRRLDVEGFALSERWGYLSSDQAPVESRPELAKV